MGDFFFQRGWLVFGNAEEEGDAACLLYRRRNTVTVRIDDLDLVKPLIEIGSRQRRIVGACIDYC